jgi:hypothetical protein
MCNIDLVLALSSNEEAFATSEKQLLIKSISFSLNLSKQPIAFNRFIDILIETSVRVDVF